MKIKKAHIVFLLLVAMVYTSCSNGKNELPSLKETYSKKDKNPFGAYVFFNQADQFFYHNQIQIKKDNFEKTWQAISDTASLYILISRNLYLTEAGQKAMLSYVNNGNSLLISSANIDTSLLNALDCKMAVQQENVYTSFLAKMHYTSIATDSAIYKGQAASYSYFYSPFSGSFAQYNAEKTRVLGLNEKGKPNFIVVFYGSGRFYLQCEPRALSNYFLLQKKNYHYLQDIFNLNPSIPEHVYWDDYYNKKNYPPSEEDSKSGLQLLLSYPATAWAFWLVLLLLAVYILFGGKRRQRIVEHLSPNINTTVAFTETVGHLYLQKKDNRNIAEKMIMYFQEYIRKQYFLNSNQVNDEFITTLSRKSNVPKTDVEDLFRGINLVHNSFETTDQELLRLNQQIELFYKNKI